jgi:hypothetical protein
MNKKLFDLTLSTATAALVVWFFAFASGYTYASGAAFADQLPSTAVARVPGTTYVVTLSAESSEACPEPLRAATLALRGGVVREGCWAAADGDVHLYFGGSMNYTVPGTHFGIFKRIGNT